MKLKILFLILAFSCGILIGLGLYFVIPPAKTSIKTADLVDDIQEDLGEEYDEEKYSKIKKEYPNIGGWIYIDEIGLSQPIMEDRGEYYLNHAYNDEEVASGALFYRPEDNTIYGHHMKDGSMFGKLEEYHNEIYTVVIDDIKDDGSYVRHTYEV